MLKYASYTVTSQQLSLNKFCLRPPFLFQYLPKISHSLVRPTNPEDNHNFHKLFVLCRWYCCKIGDMIAIFAMHCCSLNKDCFLMKFGCLTADFIVMVSFSYKKIFDLTPKFYKTDNLCWAKEEEFAKPALA